MPVMSSESATGHIVDDSDDGRVIIKHESSPSIINSSDIGVGTQEPGDHYAMPNLQPLQSSFNSSSSSSSTSSSSTTLCGGCGFKIVDRYFLVAVDKAWHSECLRCSECRRPLDTALSCFARQSRIYCRDDYYRLFGVRRCNRCCLPLGSNELVMRARDAVFHLACFTCTACNQPLAKGDIFGMRDGIVYCRLHYEMLQQQPPLLPPPSHQSPHSGNGLILPLHPHHHQHHQQQQQQQQHHHTVGLNDGPCDLSCGGGTGPHHGLLPPTGFHPHHPHSGGGGGGPGGNGLMTSFLSGPPESSLSPSGGGGGGGGHHHQHMISILAAASGGVDPLDPAAYAGGIRCSSLFVPHHDPYNPSNDFQRFGSLLGNGNGASGFFPSAGGNGSAVSPSSASSVAVQKGRPRKRKGQASQSSSTLNNNNNNSSSSNNNNNGSNNSSSNHSDPIGGGGGIIGQQQQLHNHLNAANLRQLGSIDMLGNGGDLSSMEGMVYDSSGTNGSASGGGGNGGGGGGSSSQQQSQRTKRMRTSFKHHQLRTMKSYFAINQNPDAKDLKQLAQKTGLSKRVLQVWFQNARAKWRRNIMRQQDGGGGVGGGVGGGAGCSSIKDGDLLTASASSSSSQQQHQRTLEQHEQQQHHHLHQHQHQQQACGGNNTRVPNASLGELTPPGSAGAMTHSSAVSNDDASSNLVFSDLY